LSQKDFEIILKKSPSSSFTKIRRRIQICNSILGCCVCSILLLLNNANSAMVIKLMKGQEVLGKTNCLLSFDTHRHTNNKMICVRFKVFTTVTMKNAVFLDVKPCGSCEDRGFGGTHLLVATYFLPDDGGDTFLRNVGSYKSHMASHTRREHSSTRCSHEWAQATISKTHDLGLFNRQ
jgi:hypothetical protein